MSPYTELKRGLQKNGFRVVKRIRERDVILSDGKLFMHIWGTAISANSNHQLPPYNHEDAVAYHAQLADGRPISWHNGTVFNNWTPEMWIGENCGIQRFPIANADTYNSTMNNLLYMTSAQHDGMYHTDDYGK